MKIFIVLTLSIFGVMNAQATQIKLTGKKADAFIAKHFPDAYVPGPVKGKFSGTADCFSPAMGERSNGKTTTCTVSY